TVATYGGQYGEGMRRHIFEPAGKAVGVGIKTATITDLADIRVQVKAGAVQWDIVELVTPWCVQGTEEGLFQDLDPQQVVTENFMPGTFGNSWVAGTFYAAVISWNTETFGENGPKTWADFWDVEKFPGTRGLPDRPLQSIEAALMADGVPP